MANQTVETHKRGMNYNVLNQCIKYLNQFIEGEDNCNFILNGWHRLCNCQGVRTTG